MPMHNRDIPKGHIPAIIRRFDLPSGIFEKKRKGQKKKKG